MSATLERNHEHFASDPENSQAFDALVEHYYFSADPDSWAQLVELYNHRLTAPSLQESPKHRVPVLVQLGQLIEERCLDLEKAIQYYTEAATLDPGYRPALTHLRQVYAQREQWDLVLQIADVETQTEMEPRERAELDAQLGDIWMRELQDASEALRCFERSVEADPTYTVALSRLAHALESTDRVDRAIEILTRLVDMLEGPDRAPALVQLGNVFAGTMGQPDRAAEHYRRALTDDPRNESAVEALVITAGAQQHWDLVADLLERRFNLASGARRRASIAVEAGHVHLTRLDNPEMARLWLDRAVDLAPEDPAVHRAMVELAREQNDVETLATALEAAIEYSQAPMAPSALLEAANLQSERGDEEKALRYLRMAEQQSPEDPLILEALTDALGHLGHATELAEVLERRVAQCSDDRDVAAETLLELGRVYSEDLDDAEAAILAYRRAFDSNPMLPRVTDRLEREYRKAEQWTELRSFLERAAAEGPEAKRAGSWAALGELVASQFDDGREAGRAFERALELDASLPTALAGVQRIALESDDDVAIIRAYEREARITTDPERLSFLVGEMVPRYEASDRGEDALMWVDRLLEASPDDVGALRDAARLQDALGNGDELLATLQKLDERLEGVDRLENLHHLAKLHGDQGRSNDAVAAWESILEIDGSDVAALKSLVGHYEATRRFDDLAFVYRRLETQLEGAEQVAVLGRLAKLLDRQLGDLQGAIDVLQRIRRQIPEADALETDTALEELLERTGRFEDLAAHLESRLEHAAQDDPAREALGLRLAKLLVERLDRHEAAVDVLRELREANPDHPEATEALEFALRTSGNIEGLVELLADRATRAPSPVDRARHDFERAVLLDESLSDFAAAREAYESLVDSGLSGPLTSQASQRLEAILEQQCDWEALRTRLESRLADAQAADPRGTHLRIAALCREFLDDRNGVVTHLEAAGAIDSNDPLLWQQLASIYEEQRRLDDWRRVMEAELATQPDAARECSLRGQLARLCAEHEDDSPRAVAEYERVLELDPACAEAIQYLIDHYESADQHNRVLELLELRLARARTREPADRDTRCSILMQMALLQDSILGDVDAAVHSLETALHEVGAVSGIAEPLANLYERQDALDQLIHLCGAAARTADESGERASWQERLASNLETRGFDGDLDAAIEAYRAVLIERPGDLGAEEHLRSIYRVLRQAGPLTELLNAELARSQGVEAEAIRLELASLLANELDDPRSALEHLRCVLAERPDHDDAFVQAVELTSRIGDHAGSLALIDARLATPSGVELRPDLLARRAKLLAGPLDRPEDAAEAYAKAMAENPEDGDHPKNLRQLLERLGRWRGVLDCLFIEYTRAEGEERAQLCELGAQIATERLEESDILPWLERLRGERPGDPQVVARVADLHRAAGRYEALLRTIESQLSVASDSGRRRELLVEAAEVLETRLNAPGRAIWALQTALQAQPGDIEILENLDQLYAKTGRNRDRVEVLEARLTIGMEADDPGRRLDARERLRLHEEIADLVEESFGEWERALPHRLHAVALTPNELDPQLQARLAALGTTLEKVGDADGRLRAMEAEVGLLDPASEDTRERRALLHLELARGYERRATGHDAAVKNLRSLSSLLATEGEDLLPTPDRDAAERLLIDLLRADCNFVELEERLTQRLARDPSRAVDWLELAQLRDERLHAQKRASDAYVQVLERQADNLTALRGLRRTSERLRDWSRVAQTIEDELSLAGDRSNREEAALCRRLGDLCEGRLDATERARAAYARALEADPRDLASLRALERITEASGDWEAALDYYDREIDVLGDGEPARRQQIQFQVGALARDHARDLDRAVRAYDDAAQLEEDFGECSGLTPSRRAEWADLHRESGDSSRYAEIRGQWCDDPSSHATADDHLELSEHLETQSRMQEALDRSRRAVEVDSGSARGWDAVGRLCEALGHAGDAADAVERAADVLGGSAATTRLLRAAQLIRDEDLDRAARLVRRASRSDQGSAAIQAELARITERLERWEEAQEAAGRALDLASETDDLNDRERLECALTGGRASQQIEAFDAAARFFGEALQLDPHHREALERQGDALYRCGDVGRARLVLESRLALPGEDPERARHLVIVGLGMELADECDAALEHFEEALSIDGENEEANRGAVRMHESAGRIDEAVEAIDRWVASQGESSQSAAQLLHAAELELGRDDEQSAEKYLRAALAADPSREVAWVRLAEMLWSDGRAEDALQVATDGMDPVGTAENRASLSMIRGKALEEAGRANEAAEAYADVCERDPRCIDAALSRSRLLRSTGDWSSAASCLEEFVSSYPDPSSPSLAVVYYKRGRLLAGPLEETAEAIRCYETALQLDPEFSRARKPLAGLLVHYSDMWPRAVDQHRLLLLEEPTRPESVRALVSIAEGCNETAMTRCGLALLQALGIASPEESAEAPSSLPLKLGSRPKLIDPLHEKLRQAVQAAADELATALPTASPPAGNGPFAEFDRARYESANELGAPGLLALSTPELRDFMTALGNLILEAGSDSGEPVARSLDQAVGRWTRRKLKKILDDVRLEDIANVDFDAWRRDFEIVATAVAIDRCDGDLRTALSSLIRSANGDSEEMPDSADLSPMVSSSPIATGLMSRVMRTWCADLAARLT